VFIYPDGAVVDGWARIEAAREAGVDVRTHRPSLDHPDELRARRRDTPLHRILLAVDTNAHRLTADERQLVLDAAAVVTGRPWAAIQSDLDLTRRWRGAIAPAYVAVFDVKELAYQPGSSSKIMVTADQKVAVTSLLRAAGLPAWETSKNIKFLLHLERARPAISSGGKRKVGRAQDFAPADELLLKLRAMVEERGKDPVAWSGPISWLEAYLAG
jgi:hypothetical protein